MKNLAKARIYRRKSKNTGRHVAPRICYCAIMRARSPLSASSTYTDWPTENTTSSPWVNVTERPESNLTIYSIPPWVDRPCWALPPTYPPNTAPPTVPIVWTRVLSLTMLPATPPTIPPASWPTSPFSVRL